MVIGLTINMPECYLFRAHNPKVVGSNPTPATNKDKGLQVSICEPFVYLASRVGAM